MTRIPLTLGKHFLLIDSPISFYLIDNEENSVYRPSGVWQLDTWKLLPEKYQKDHPVYTLMIEYDEGKLADGKEVVIRESDIDLGDGVAGVSGQAVMLTGINDSILPIPVSVKNFPDIQNVKVTNNPTSIGVNNFPDVQKVSVQNNPTSIAVNNLPANQKVTVTNVPDIQKVSVQNNPTSIGVNNFPANQKVNVSNFPANQNVTVTNVPNIQKVSVQNNPTSIGVNNFPANQKVNVSNFPDVQKVNVQNVALIRVPLVLASSFKQFTDFNLFMDTLRNYSTSIKCIIILTSLDASENELLVNFNFPIFLDGTGIVFYGYYKSWTDPNDYFSERFRRYSLQKSMFARALVYSD